MLGGPGGPAISADAWIAGPGAPGVVIVHGAGSNRQNHHDYARRVASAGMSAVAVDLRGHGESGGALDAGTIDDVLAALDWLAEQGAGPLGLRGSSLGGFLALNAAARHHNVRAVVAIAPAQERGLADRRGLKWALDMPLHDAVARNDGVARGYWHAHGDEIVPWTWSWSLSAHSPHPRHLRVVMGGNHQSLQHDPLVQADTVSFLRGHLAG
jgi:dienelactone hydrolase